MQFFNCQYKLAGGIEQRGRASTDGGKMAKKKKEKKNDVN